MKRFIIIGVGDYVVAVTEGQALKVLGIVESADMEGALQAWENRDTEVPKTLTERD